MPLECSLNRRRHLDVMRSARSRRLKMPLSDEVAASPVGIPVLQVGRRVVGGQLRGLLEYVAKVSQTLHIKLGTINQRAVEANRAGTKLVEADKCPRDGHLVERLVALTATPEPRQRDRLQVVRVSDRHTTGDDNSQSLMQIVRCQRDALERHI